MFVEKPIQEVRLADLPLACPPEDALWNGHPRVFLSFEKSSEARCSYCGMRYRLVEDILSDHRS